MNLLACLSNNRKKRTSESPEDGITSRRIHCEESGSFISTIDYSVTVDDFGNKKNVPTAQRYYIIVPLTKRYPDPRKVADESALVEDSQVVHISRSIVASLPGNT